MKTFKRRQTLVGSFNKNSLIDKLPLKKENEINNTLYTEGEGLLDEFEDDDSPISPSQPLLDLYSIDYILFRLTPSRLKYLASQFDEHTSLSLV